MALKSVLLLVLLLSLAPGQLPPQQVTHSRHSSPVTRHSLLLVLSLSLSEVVWIPIPWTCPRGLSEAGDVIGCAGQWCSRHFPVSVPGSVHTIHTGILALVPPPTNME